jgi:hypothetical protein
VGRTTGCCTALRIDSKSHDAPVTVTRRSSP